MTPLLLAAAIAAQADFVSVINRPILFPKPGQETVLEFPDVRKGGDFQEAIPSWNVESPLRGALKVEMRARGEGFETKWYTLAQWSADGTSAPRVSVEGQKDDDGNVLTDTLRLKKPAASWDLRVTLRTLSEGPRPRLKLLTVALSGAEDGAEAKPYKAVWGKVIEVPQRAQGNYPGGEVLCSPTSLSMVLAHWSRVLGRPELDKDVPEVQAGVWDAVYEGAGNWPFNAAYAGSLPGMQGYVARLRSIAELEGWIEAGIPVICSAPLSLLRGETPGRDSGHLVVLVGFTKTGDPVFNDQPAVRSWSWSTPVGRWWSYWRSSDTPSASSAGERDRAEGLRRPRDRQAVARLRPRRGWPAARGLEPRT